MTGSRSKTCGGCSSCIVKTDEALHTIAALSTPESRKDFTRRYEAYIEDRNRYTHGILFFLYPEFLPVLRIKDAEGAPQYLCYEPQVFHTNLQTFDFLSSVLGEIRNQILSGMEAGGR